MAQLMLPSRAMIDRAGLSRFARILWPYVALWLLVATALLGFAGYELRHNRDAALATGRAEAENLARVMAEHMRQVLEAADRTLTLAKLVREHRLASEPLAAITESMKPPHGTEAERRVNVFDREGRFVASTDRQVEAAGVSVDDRTYFQHARTGSDAALFIGDAIVGRVSRSLIIPVAKRVVAPGGEFDGIVAIALDPQRLVHLFRALHVGERSSVGIAHRDGPVLAYAHAGASDGGSAPGTIGEVVQGERVIALEAVPGTELIAFASLSEEELLAGYRRFGLATLAFVVTALGAISVPIVLVGGRAWREVGRRHVLELRYASVAQQARTDPLTGLANRTGFDEARRVAYDRLKRTGTPFALAFVDIDHFKRVNDTLGHAAGDEALRAVAETLTGCVRQSDAVGRLGGDEFAVLMPGVNAGTMHRRFDPIKHDLDTMVARHGWPISFSIGVVACESATPRARDAVNLADRMMYDAKGAGRDAIRYAVFRDGRLVTEDRERVSA